MPTTRPLALAGALAGVLSTAVGPASAHVDYVTEGGSTAGSFGELLAAVLSHPVNVALLVGGAAATVAVAVGYLATAHRLTDAQVARSTLSSYRPYLSWILRLSVGIPLVGAGFGGYLYSPAVPVEARLFQVAIGFLLLFGLAVRPVAAVGLAGYLVTLALHPEAILAVELAGGFVALVLAGSGQPSADLLLQRLVDTEGTLASRLPGLERWLTVTLAESGLGREWVPVVLRATLGVGFVYLGVTQKWLAPGPALSLVEKYNLTAVAPLSPEMWVFTAGLLEVVLGVALLVGLFTRGVAAVAFLTFTLTLFALPDDPVVAHVSLFGLTSALLVTGGGPLSLDEAVVPSIRESLGWPSPAETPV